MSTMTPPSQIWNTMPGWGIVADLTPPELIDSRRLKLLRKFLALLLLVVLVISAAVYAYAYLGNVKAQSALTDEQSRTSELQSTQGKYRDVTQIQTKLNQVNGQVAGVMQGDVDLQPLLAELRKALPGSLTIKTLALSVNSAPNGAAGTPGLDTSGYRSIGSVTLDGNALSYAGVAQYVDALSNITGVTNVVPTSAQSNKIVISYNITLNLTDQVLSHRFDATQKAGN